MCHEMKFKTAIRGHHECKTTWTPVMNEWLICKKDEREKAVERDPNAVGVYKELPAKGTSELAGHTPIELSRIVAGFLGASEINSVSVQVCGKRKREVGLIIPGMYRARTKRRKHAKILSEEQPKIAERHPYFEFEIQQNLLSKPVLVKQTANHTN